MLGLNIVKVSNSSRVNVSTLLRERKLIISQLLLHIEQPM